MSVRRSAGRETRDRLLNWDGGQSAAERLAVQLLHADGYRSIDPSHPMGGPDGLKDAVCTRDGLRWIAAVYFPRGEQTFSKIKSKFLADLKGARANNVQGFAFVTNQDLTVSQREELKAVAIGPAVEILHLERMGSILNQPQNYGVRLEFLDLEMTRDEQIAFIAARDTEMRALRSSVESLRDDIKQLIARSQGSGATGTIAVPLAELQEFKSVLDKVTESNMSRILSGDYLSSNILSARSGNINDLRVPLHELREFADLLDRITGQPGYATSGTAAALTVYGKIAGHVDRLRVPLADLQEYEKLLDRIIEKRRVADGLESSFTATPRLPKV